MTEMHRKYYEKRGAILVKNLKSRHFDAYYCATKDEALAKALELIPQGASVGWGGVMSAHEIGLVKALNEGNYNAIDRDKCSTQEEKLQAAKDSMFADVFLTGANALSFKSIFHCLIPFCDRAAARSFMIVCRVIRNRSILILIDHFLQDFICNTSSNGAA